MATAKAFQSGSSQAGRSPKAFRFSTGDVAVFRHDDELLLLERRPSLDDVLDPLLPWADDITPKASPDLPVHGRKGL